MNEGEPKRIGQISDRQKEVLDAITRVSEELISRGEGSRHPEWVLPWEHDESIDSNKDLNAEGE